jgi:hypothetical protein
MLRITVHDNPRALTFQLEGSLTGPWLRVLEEFGLFLTPVFLYVIRGLVQGRAPVREPAAVAANGSSRARGVAMPVPPRPSTGNWESVRNGS